jgi:predicted transcriptional regulator
MEHVGSILFEVSNDDRHRILVTLESEALNLSNLSKIIDMNLPETSRHISRLLDVDLIQKNIDGTYDITSYGRYVIRLVKNIEFFTEYKDFFLTHSSDEVPDIFSSRLDVFSGSRFFKDVMDFVRILNRIISKAEHQVNILIENYPWVAIPSIIQALNRGIKFRIMEKSDNAEPGSDSVEDEGELPERIKMSPLVEYATLDQVGPLVIYTENSAAFILPNNDGRYDFNGFFTTNITTINWCKEVFNHFWNIARKFSQEPVDEIDEKKASLTSITIEGTENSSIDPYTVQDAVDNYERVTLKGAFNFGNTSVLVKKSVHIKGVGRDILGYPNTMIYKRGWSFPFYESDSIFQIDGDDINVTIEDIHFKDFNCSAIWGDYGNSLTIRNCDFTIKSGHYKGLSSRAYGDILYGIYVGFPYERYLQGKRGSFPGGINIEGNWIHFSWGGRDQSGYVSYGSLEMDPEYRPDLSSHEYYMGMGIFIEMAAGNVEIKKNWIWYSNARGISVVDCFDTASVTIRENIIKSENYGSYPYREYLAGIGIFAQNGFNFTDERGCYVEIANNIIEFTKMNYCGIGIMGPYVYEAEEMGHGKLTGGIIRDNKITMQNGHVGIIIQGSDDFKVSMNEITGTSYYGIQVSGKEKLSTYDRGANGNIIEKNDFSELKLRDPDEYCKNHSDGIMFSESPVNESLAHIWLNPFSKNNKIVAHPKDIVIEEGQSNLITRNEFTLIKKKQLRHPLKYQ